MTDQRARFEEWWDMDDLANSGPYRNGSPMQHAWEAWQAATTAAEADKWAAVRRCVLVIEHAPATREGMVELIKAEFPEAFPVDPNKWAFDRGLEST